MAIVYDHPFREFALEAGFRSLLTVPMTGNHPVEESSFCAGRRVSLMTAWSIS